MLVYVEHIICIHKDPDSVHKVLNNYFFLKPDSVGTPNIYLSANLKHMPWEWGLDMGSLSLQVYKGSGSPSIFYHNMTYQSWHSTCSQPSMNQVEMFTLNLTQT